MEFAEYLPFWDKLTKEQQDRVASVIEHRSVSKGSHIHDSSADCLGLVVMKSGQLRAYILSEAGREITIGRLFDYDVSLLSASCVMPDMQFNVMIDAEKDSEFWSIPACLFKNLVDESLAVSNYARNLLSGNFSELMWLMEQIMWKSFDKRLAAFLLEESNPTTASPMSYFVLNLNSFIDIRLMVNTIRTCILYSRLHHGIHECPIRLKNHPQHPCISTA